MKAFFDFLKALIKVREWWKLLIIAFVFCFGIGSIVYVLKYDGLDMVKGLFVTEEKIITVPAQPDSVNANN